MGDMLPIVIPPGVVETPTNATPSANWKEVNLIRWKNGRASPIGGWEKLDYPAFASKIRRVHSWSDNNGIKRTLYLCEGHVYLDEGGTITDISPVDPLVLPTADTQAGGYGDYIYSYGTYGTPRPERTRIKVVAPSYTVYNWGEEVLFMTSADGRLLRWRPSAPLEVANAVPGAPLGNRTFVVTPERYVILFCPLGNFRRFSWCDQENYSNWTISDETTAGSFDVEPAAAIVAASLVPDGVVFWTSSGAFIIRYSGLPYVYSYRALADGTVPVSAASVCNTAVGLIWKSDSGFWIYNGGSVVPLPCPILNWIDGDFHEFLNRYEAAGIVVNTTSEMWWFFTTSLSTENDKFVVYNFRDGWWSMGKASRVCGFSPSYDSYPLMSDGEFVYKHESGFSYPGSPELPWAETFVLNVGYGGNLCTITQMIPDVGAGLSAVSYRFAMTMQRMGGVEVMSPFKTTRDDGFVDVYETARDFRLRIEMVGASDWTFGQFLAEFKKRGNR